MSPRKSFEPAPGKQSMNFSSQEGLSMAPPPFQLTADGGPEGKACQETDRRAGNHSYFGAREHEMIQWDYKARHHAAREYLVPGGGLTGGPGYADIVNLDDMGFFEIKPMGAEKEALEEVTRYVEHARLGCDQRSHLGTGYGTRRLPAPNLPGLTMVVFQEGPGVLIYDFEKPEGEPMPVNAPIPYPNPAEPGKRPEEAPGKPEKHPEPELIDKIVGWAEEVYEAGKDASVEAERFMQENPDIAWAVIGIGVLGIGALALDDLSGVGIADDFLIPIIARLLAVAWKYI